MPQNEKGTLPQWQRRLRARENKFCQICNCAYIKGVKLCFECSEFPCENTKSRDP